MKKLVSILLITISVAMSADAPRIEDARASLYARRYPAAVTMYQQILENDKTSGAAYYDLVRAFLAEHRIKEAYDAADRAIEHAANTAPGQTAAGLAAYRKGDIIEAERHFRTALKIEPQDPGAMRGLALIYTAISKFKSAHDLIDKAHQLAPDDPALAVDNTRGDEKLRCLTSPYTMRKRRSSSLRLAPARGRSVDSAFKSNLMENHPRHYCSTQVRPASLFQINLWNARPCSLATSSSK
jgi:tetratricopeptide (TPR) repeat protein